MFSVTHHILVLNLIINYDNQSIFPALVHTVTIIIKNYVTIFKKVALWLNGLQIFAFIV